MKKYKAAYILALLCVIVTIADAQEIQKSSTYLEVGAALGSSTISGIGALHHDWNLGKKNRIVVGTGVRFTGFLGKDINFITAPADLSVDDANIDTLLGPTPKIYSLNLLINLGYRVSEKLQVGFSIDALGVSFGPTGTPTYIRNDQSRTVSAKPTSPNILLVGDNDRGSLNSHFYIKYRIGQHIGIKIAYQYLFNELKTSSEVQTIPQKNDRFRYKSSSAFVGLNYTF